MARQYKIVLQGLSPLIMHADNMAFMEVVERWRKDPGNKELSVSGDDRSPSWTWLSYLYHNRRELGIPSDNLMTMIREGGAKISKGRGNYAKSTQAGLIIDQDQFRLLIKGEPVPVAPFDALRSELDFNVHLDAAEQHGFELLVKRAKIKTGKHVRVRPMFRDWTAEGSLTVLDEHTSGLTEDILTLVLNQAGALCGLGDWRPSSGKSGTFGRFQPHIKAVKA